MDVLRCTVYNACHLQCTPYNVHCILDSVDRLTEHQGNI